MIYILVEICILLFLLFLTLPYKNYKYLKKKQYFEYYNTVCIRGLAIIFVIIQHTAGNFEIRYFTPLGGIGVAIFLLLSGYGLNESFKEKGLDKFWEKKILRVYIPYMLVVFFSYIFTNDKDILSKLFLIKSDYWFIQFILAWYIIFYIYKKVKMSNILVLFIPSIIILLFCRSTLAEQAISFPLGILLSDYKLRLEGKQFIKYGIYFFVLGTLFLCLKQYIRELSPNIILNIIQLIIKLSYAVSTIIIITELKFLSYSKFIFITGLISYELYLVHMKFRFIVTENKLSVIVFLLISFSLSYILYKLNNFITRKIKSKHVG